MLNSSLLCAVVGQREELSLMRYITRQNDDAGRMSQWLTLMELGRAEQLNPYCCSGNNNNTRIMASKVFSTLENIITQVNPHSNLS
jgi:hypothetical protein